MMADIVVRLVPACCFAKGNEEHFRGMDGSLIDQRQGIPFTLYLSEFQFC